MPKEPTPQTGVCFFCWERRGPYSGDLPVINQYDEYEEVPLYTCEQCAQELEEDCADA